MHTEFTPIPGYETLYEINHDGLVQSRNRNYKDSRGRVYRSRSKAIASRIDKFTGYPVVKLTKLDKSYGTQLIHRLLAKTFIPNPLNKCCVNHINGDKHDYSLNNLEWVTNSENQLHAIKSNLARIPRQNSIPVINVCTGVKYNSISEAAQAYPMNYGICKKVLSGMIPNDTCLRRVV